MTKISKPRASPLVTIIITTFQRAGLVPQAIDSVLSQTYSNVDIVVVEDGSTDHTAEVLARYEGNPRIRIVRHDSNRGVTAAKNTGLRELGVETTYFGILDSDDTLLPDAVDRLVREFERAEDQYSMIIGWCESVPPGHQTGEMRHLVDRTGPLKFDDALAGRFRGEFWHLARRDLLGAMHFEERASGGEGSVWWRLLRSRPGWVIPDVVRIYDISGHDRVSLPAYTRRAAVGMMWRQQAMLHAVGEDLLRQDPRAYARWLTELAKWAALGGDGPRARLASRRAVRLAPSFRSIGIAVLAISPGPLLGQIAAAVAWVRARGRAA